MYLNTKWFPKAVPAKPSGQYAHIIVVRVTDSYAVFQTDGELNTARVQAGLVDASLMTRITLFKRKQTTPERLTGREWLRRHGILSPELPDEKAKSETDAKGRLICDYNVAFCRQCPDCIAYGFAIGNGGSEKSKVIADTSYSLTDYDTSHEVFTLNAPYEEGTMSRKGEVTSRINEADHVRPQVIFPSVITVRDATAALFEYVLSNVLRTRRYGAQTTRTGTMSNHVLAIVLADGEIFSNLKLVQALFDALKAKQAFAPPDPVDVGLALAEAHSLIPGLLKADSVSVDQLLMGSELEAVLTKLRQRLDDEAESKAIAQAALADSQAYHQAYIAKPSKKKS